MEPLRRTLPEQADGGAASSRAFAPVKLSPEDRAKEAAVLVALEASDQSHAPLFSSFCGQSAAR